MKKEKIGEVSLNYEHYIGIDLYSDGKVEDEILEIVQRYDKEELEMVIDKYDQWPILYHLSPVRSNIVEGLPISNTDSVLEIGAGCGAITGMLLDKAKKVTSIDLSKKRSMINAYRNKNKNNLEILVGNFEDIEKTLQEKYDFITLIGVFEYAASYIKAKDPYEAFLNQVKKHLKQDGKIIIAIENKWGMKYWAGCKEDHVGKEFEGIEGYKNSSGARTFTKKELEELFKKCSLSNYQFYYPYPDYKFPDVIYSDKYLPKKGELNHNINLNDNERIVLFNEMLAFDNVIENEMFPLYSNSYLILVGKDEV